MVFIKIANDIANDLDFIIRNGIEQLMEDMKKAPKFDSSNPNCNEKNDYFNNANNICQFSLWKLRLYDLSERYYAMLLMQIREYEKNNNTNFNKGMVYANLGVSQATQGKIDEGFANILKAIIEDEPCHKTNPSQTIFASPLYTQFENRIIEYILEHSQLYQKEESKTIDKTFIGTIISSLDTDSHILLISLIEKIRRNLDVFIDKDNRFTRLQIFLCLQDLCLSIENALKKKNTLSRTIKELLDVLFSNASGRPRLWKSIFDSNYGFTSSYNASQFESNLIEILKIGDNKARRLLICCAVRNFSSHNLDVGIDYVFKNIELIFDNILSSIFFLHDGGCI